MDAFDLILFAGQSNMAGRGCAEDAPACPAGAGWEYRAVTAPRELHPLAEPFGRHENRPGAIDDGERKVGGLVSAFAAEYCRLTGRAVVGVSASRGGTSSAQWVDGLAEDAASRLEQARGYLKEIGRAPQHIWALWCQGETDGDDGVPAKRYRENFAAIWRTFQRAGAECCGLIEIGHYNRRMFPQGQNGLTGAQLDARYAIIREEQARIAGTTPGVFHAGSFEPWEARMKDAFHYFQSAYNAVGAAAAQRAAAAIRQAGSGGMDRGDGR